MSTVDRKNMITGERETTWWCGFCWGKGKWVVVGPTEQDRRDAARLIASRYDDHRCVLRKQFERRNRIGMRRRVL